MSIITGTSKTECFHIFKKEDDETIIGRMRLYLIYNDLHEFPYALVEDLFVEEEHRGKGIAQELMRELERIAIANRCYKIVAGSRFMRPKVHTFYERLGYEKHGYDFRKYLI